VVDAHVVFIRNASLVVSIGPLLVFAHVDKMRTATAFQREKR
jgi:DNA-directed RNA polymerase subunit E'/Rpb7